MAGRKKQPIDLLVLKGKAKPTKAEIEERKKQEIKAPKDNLEPPEHLTDDLKERFNWYVNEMKDLGMIANLDVESLARYVSAQKVYEILTVKLLELDPMLEDYGRILRSQDIAFKQARSLANDLGFTVTSRCKIVIPKKEEKEEKTKAEKKFGNLI